MHQRFVVAVANGGDSTELDAELIAGAQALGAGRPSLLQDVIRGRRVEIDALNGWVADRGQDVEVPTPCNNAIAEVVRSFPVGTLRPDPTNLQSVSWPGSTSIKLRPAGAVCRVGRSGSAFRC